MHINGFIKTTLLDYPKHLAATIFLGNCNYRCPFCHNSSLVLDNTPRPVIPTREVLDTLKKRQGILEGVCITGGEPTLSADLPELIRTIKDLNLKVKLDTNGSNPAMLHKLLEEDLLDYIAMDIKNCREKYATTIGVKNFNIEPLEESISYIQESGIDYEFRTTIVKELHTCEDMKAIGSWLHGSTNYYLQSYKDSGDILTPGLHPHNKDTLHTFQSIVQPYFKMVAIRGIES